METLEHAARRNTQSSTRGLVHNDVHSQRWVNPLTHQRGQAAMHRAEMKTIVATSSLRVLCRGLLGVRVSAASPATALYSWRPVPERHVFGSDSFPGPPTQRLADSYL